MSQLGTLFSFKGRLSRLGYWRSQNVIALLLAGVWVGMLLATMASPLGPWVGLLLLPVLVAMVAIATRRLHDRGKSIWWLALFIGVPSSSFVGVELLLERGDPTTPPGALLLAILGLAVMVWFTVEMGLFGGSKTTNRFGPPPPPYARRRRR